MKGIAIPTSGKWWTIPASKALWIILLDKMMSLLDVFLLFPLFPGCLELFVTRLSLFVCLFSRLFID
jgi:hypothetical protein